MGLINKLVCRVQGHGPEIRSEGKPLGSTSPYCNDYIYIYCSRCKALVRRYRDW